MPVLRDARRRALASAEIDPRSTAGGDVALTLDAAVQAEAEQALADGVAAAKARGGLVVAIEPKTGDVLALAEYPPFDPNEFRDTPFERTRARSFLDAVEPGSTMKPIVVAARAREGRDPRERPHRLRGRLVARARARRSATSTRTASSTSRA